MTDNLNSPVARGAEAAASAAALSAAASVNTVRPFPRPKPSEAMARFQELVTAAIDQFNKGSLDQAATLLGLAGRWQAEHALDPAGVDLVRSRLGQALDAEWIRNCAEQVDDRPVLRAILGFFSAYAPDALLEALRPERLRERRRWLLLLLEVYGETARAAAGSRLKQALGDAPDAEEWYFRRNLLHLLRRIPCDGEAHLGEEVGLAVIHSRLGMPSFVIKEAVGLLGQIRDERSEIALIHLLEELEDMLPSRESFWETRDLPAVADRVATTLAAFPTPRAHGAVVDYAERIRVECGRAMTALAGLGRHDLSSDEATVDRLIGLLRRGRLSDASGKPLAPRTDQDHEHMVPVIEALSGTPLPVVRRALEAIVRSHSAKSSGRAAAKALAELGRREPVA